MVVLYAQGHIEKGNTMRFTITDDQSATPRIRIFDHTSRMTLIIEWNPNTTDSAVMTLIPEQYGGHYARERFPTALLALSIGLQQMPTRHDCPSREDIGDVFVEAAGRIRTS